MRALLVGLIAGGLFATLTPPPAHGRDASAISPTATDSVERLSPARFGFVPPAVRHVLARRGCLVPQDTGRVGLRNVVRGNFTGAGRENWAARCSRGSITTLLVIRTGTALRVDSLAAMPDNSGRSIRPATPVYIWRLAAFYAEVPKDTAGLRPVLRHAGIENGSGCCSRIFFWDGLRWRELPGAD